MQQSVVKMEMALETSREVRSLPGFFAVQAGSVAEVIEFERQIRYFLA